MPPFLVKMFVVVDASTAGEAVKQATNGEFRCVMTPPEVRAHGQFCVDRDCHLVGEMHGNFECKAPEWWRGLPTPPGYKLVRSVNRSEAEKALRELVDLKAMKDLDGKTPEYEERQPRAWAVAREVLGLNA